MNQPRENQRDRNASQRPPRVTPTYYHHNIFGEEGEKMAASWVRVTPTFQSTVMDCEGYQILAHHSRAQTAKEQKKPDPQPKKDDQPPKKIDNPSQPIPHSYNCSRVNDEKARISEDINHLDGRTSRLRKCVEMMSNPIFGGHSWAPFLVKEEPKKEPVYNPDLYRADKEKHKQPKQELPPKQEEPKQPPKAQKTEPPAPPKKVPTPAPKAPAPNTKHQSALKRFKSASTLKKR